MLVSCDFASSEFDEAVRVSGRRAFEATPAAGFPVYYLEFFGNWRPARPERSVPVLSVIAGPNGSGARGDHGQPSVFGAICYSGNHATA